jgi:hypothetical protein
LERPADFVPTGDEKLDRLRLLVQQQANRDRRATGAGANPPAAAASGRGAMVTSGDGAASASPRQVGAVPGGLARSMRPESVVVASTPGTTPRPGGATPTPNSSATPRRTRQPEPSKQERLKHLLIERGVIADDRVADDPAPADRAPESRRSDDRATDARASDARADRSQAGTDEVVRRRPAMGSSPGASPGSRPGSSPSRSDGTAAGVPRSSAPPARPATHESRTIGDTARRTAASPELHDGPRAAAAGLAGDSSAASPLGRDASSTAPRSSGGIDSVSGSFVGADSGSRSSVAVADRTVAPGAASSQRRVRRLLRSDRLDLDGDLLVDDPVDTSTSPAASPLTSTGAPAATAMAAPTLVSPTPPPSAVVPVARALMAAVAPFAARHRIRSARTPTLPGDLLGRRGGDVTLRRLTLPRATSTTHRPPSSLPTPGRSTLAAPRSVAALGVAPADQARTSAAGLVGGATVDHARTSASGTAGSVVTARAIAAPTGRPGLDPGRVDTAPVGPPSAAGPSRATTAPTGRVDVPTDGGANSAAVRRATTAAASRAAGPAVTVRDVDGAVARRGDPAETARVGTATPRAEPGETDAATVRLPASGAAARGHGPTGSDRPSPTVPTSTIRASDAALQRAVATAAIRRAVPTSTPTPQRPTTRSLVAPGTGTLADVVRRSTATPSAATSTPVASDRVDSARPAERSDAVPGVARVPSTPAEVVAARFMTALSATVQRRPAPLPTPFRPMADAIAGRRPVMLSTDAASRRALRSVRKVAATTGDTIHLDPDAVPRSRLDEVVAHELTHIAHPSPAPRFFDDIDDSPEERRAEQVASIMARSPLAPSSSVVAPTSPSGVDGSRTIRRSAATIGAHRAGPGAAVRSNGGVPSAGASTSGSSMSSAPTVSAAALAARLTGSSTSPTSSAPAGPNAVIHRKIASSATPDPSVSSDPVSASSPPSGSSPREAPSHSSAPFSNEREAAEWFDKRLAANVGPLLRMIEDRMRIELERRGGRNWRRS